MSQKIRRLEHPEKRCFDNLVPRAFCHCWVVSVPIITKGPVDEVDVLKETQGGTQHSVCSNS